MADLAELADTEEFVDLPDFANQKNRELYAKLKQTEKDLSVAVAELNETRERISVMESHLASVVTEQQHTQRLVDAKVKEIETEDHLKQLAEREKGRFGAELKKLQRESDELADKATAAQAKIFKSNEKMDQFKLQMNWNQEELEQWALAARQKEEDNLALLKYSKADETKLKDLNLQLERVLSAVVAKQRELDEEVTETQARQIELDKTAEDFRALHRERRDLVRQWEDAVAAMQKRDEAIARAHEEFSKVKRELAERQDALAEKEAFLQTEQRNNAEVEMKITGAERTMSRKRDEQLRYKAAVEAIEEQVDAARSTLGSAASEMSKRRAQITQLAETTEQKKAQLEQARAKLSAAEMAAAKSKENMGSLEHAAKQMEELHAAEVLRLKERAREEAFIKEKIYNESRALSEARQEESNLSAEISGALRVARNASQKIAQLDSEAQRQKELVYTADFQLQLMERKVARATGVRSAIEQTELKKKIDELQKQLEQHNATHTMLAQQGKRLANDLKRAKRHSEELQVEHKRLTDAIAEVEINNELAQKELKKLVTQKQEGMVSSDVLKLEVKRLRETLNAKMDEVFGLQNRKHQLQMSMDERQQEIKVHTDVLRAQLKAAEDERSQAKKELTDRLLRVDRLTNKYAIVSGKMGEGEEGEGHSQAYYIIKAAQERDELQRQGDELDQQIQKAEREVRALEKTLNHLFAKNAGYKASFEPVEKRTPQYEQKVQLEEQHRVALSKYRSHRLQQSELEEEIGQMEVTLQEIEDEKGMQENQLASLADQSAQLQDDVQEKRTRLEQVRTQVRELLEQHRANATGVGLEGLTTVELEVAMTERQTRNKAILEKLAALSAEDPEFGNTLERYCAESGIPPPSAMPGGDDDE
mmetsp:Transcript_10381/g.31931  ORF Transcript_10381/g.31931 Transcript_10381/m.31931 type:complete len:882 (-) Transcript_10381:323-2968(-)